MKFIENNFTKRHLFVALGIWLSFAVLTCWIANHAGPDWPGHTRRASLTTCGTILGPMTGAILKDGQRCCLRFSLSLLPYCGALLILGAIPLFVKLPFRRGSSLLRMTMWVFGLLGWFLGGILSFGHALD
jgi:hypothetical protein